MGGNEWQGGNGMGGFPVEILVISVPPLITLNINNKLIYLGDVFIIDIIKDIHIRWNHK